MVFNILYSCRYGRTSLVPFDVVLYEFSRKNGRLSTVTLQKIWDKLSMVQNLRFRAVSDSSTGWKGHGEGKVKVSHPESNILVFAESGTWTPNGNSPLVFSNCFRWSQVSKRIRLEHLRFGPRNPVFLFELIVVDSFVMKSTEPHV